jgi:rhodanese-related sulfurtransferase
MFKIRNMNLSQNEWATKSQNDENAIIIDVRTDEEWNEGIIPNAIKNDVLKGTFVDNLAQLDKNKNYYVYCKAGGRSAKACEIMNDLGFKNTYNLVGGFMQWQGDVESN